MRLKTNEALVRGTHVAVASSLTHDGTRRTARTELYRALELLDAQATVEVFWVGTGFAYTFWCQFRPRPCGHLTQALLHVEMENLKRRRAELKRSLKAAAKDAKVLQNRRARLLKAGCAMLAAVMWFLSSPYIMAVIAADFLSCRRPNNFQLKICVCFWQARPPAFRKLGLSGKPRFCMRCVSGAWGGGAGEGAEVARPTPS